MRLPTLHHLLYRLYVEDFAPVQVHRLTPERLLRFRSLLRPVPLVAYPILTRFYTLGDRLRAGVERLPPHVTRETDGGYRVVPPEGGSRVLYGRTLLDDTRQLARLLVLRHFDPVGFMSHHDGLYPDALAELTGLGIPASFDDTYAVAARFTLGTARLLPGTVALGRALALAPHELLPTVRDRILTQLDGQTTLVSVI